MKKLYTIALLSLAAVGLDAGTSFAWNWCGTGSHVMVVFGYDSSSQSVWVLNPEDADSELVTYDEWANNLCPAYDHTFQQIVYGIE